MLSKIEKLFREWDKTAKTYETAALKIQKKIASLLDQKTLTDDFIANNKQEIMSLVDNSGKFSKVNLNSKKIFRIFQWWYRGAAFKI